MTVANGYRYNFALDGLFRKTSGGGDLQQAGSYSIEGDESFLGFEIEGEQKILGYLLQRDGSTIALSPSYPAICFAACISRFKRE